MPTHATESHTGLGAAAKQVAERASTIVKLELELAALELKRKVASLTIGIGLALGAAVFLLFGLGFGLATAAAALATTMSTWLALLIVAGALVLVAVLLGVFALSAIKRATPPLPEQAIREAKLTSEALRGNGAS